VDEGITECAWYPLDEALRTISYDNAREVLQRAAEMKRAPRPGRGVVTPVCRCSTRAARRARGEAGLTRGGRGAYCCVVPYRASERLLQQRLVDAVVLDSANLCGGRDRSSRPLPPHPDLRAPAVRPTTGRCCVVPAEPDSPDLGGGRR